MGFSLWWLLLLQKMDSRACRLSHYGTWVYLPHGMWNLPGPGIKPMSLHWQADCQPLDHQRSPFGYFFFPLHQETSSSLNFTLKYETLAYIITDSMQACLHIRSFSEPFKIYVIKIPTALLSWHLFYFLHCFGICVSLQVK